MHKKKETEINESSAGTNPDAARVKLAKTGNREAFEQLARHYYGDIFRMIYYRTRSRTDTEDLTQEVFLKAYQGLDRLTDEARFKSWLFRIAVNRVHDFHRRRKFLHLFKIVQDDDLDTHADPHTTAEPDPLEALILKRFRQESATFLSRLSKMEKDVFMLRFMDRLQINEIATVLKKGESTVKTHLYRALSKFKKDRAFQHFLKGE
jgi:RNA polymerase sigma-70 factor (ECF subfamily)